MTPSGTSRAAFRDSTAPSAASAAAGHPGQDTGRCPHRAGDQRWLPGLAQVRGDITMAVLMAVAAYSLARSLPGLM